MNLSTEKKITDLENRLVAALRGAGGSGRDQELGVNGYKLFLLEWIYRSCCVALRTMSRTMGGKMYTCNDNLIRLLYSGEKEIFF